MSKLRIIVLLGGGLGLLGSAWASDPGTTGASILNVGVGARAIGMGEAYTALSDDVSSLYWNPAGMALMNQSEASFMYNQWLKDLAYQHASVGVPLENGGVGAGVSYLSFGTINGFDNSGNPTGDVNAYSGMASLSGAWLGDTWSAGATAKGIQTTLADVQANGFAFDLGGHFIYPQEILGSGTLRLAATVRNLGSGMTFLNQTDPFPTEWRLGAALLQMFDNKLNVDLDYGQRRSESGAFYTGAEYRVIPSVALRMGYAGSHTESNGFRAGIGLNYKALAFDYAYATYGDLGLTSLYELTYRFGTPRPLLTPEERRMLRRARRFMSEGEYGKALLLLDALVKMEPRYKLFQKLERTAMAGLEGQERLAGKEPGRYNTMNVMSKPAPGSPSDLDDLEQLLGASESSYAQGQKAKKP